MKRAVNVLRIVNAQFVEDEMVFRRKTRMNLVVVDQLRDEVRPRVHHERRPCLATLEQLGVVANLARLKFAFIDADLFKFNSYIDFTINLLTNFFRLF